MLCGMQPLQHAHGHDRRECLHQRNLPEKYGYSPITREMLDEFSYHSQEKAAKAIADGAFKDEIVPVVIKARRATPCSIPMKAPA